MIFKKITVLMAAGLWGAVAVAQAPQPVTLTIKQAEELFFKNNFMLLAQQYNIDKSAAQIIQAKVYPNPEVTADMIAYEGQNYRTFPTGSGGNFAAGFEQLILLGGKRRAQINLAKTDKKLAEAELTDITRNLQMQIWEAFYTLHNQQKVIEKYNKLLDKLDYLISGYQVQVDKNNIALKDLVRLKSVYVKINNDKSEETAVLIEQQQKLNILLGITASTQTIYTTEDANLYADNSVLYEDVLSKSKTNRPDLNVANLEIESAKINVSLQKRLAIPDITLRAGYNQQGDAFLHQANVGIGIPLPIFDRNRGNIQTAKIQVEQGQKNAEYKQLQIENEVLAAYQNYTRSVEEYKRITKLINEDFDAVFEGMNNNFRKGNVSMIEFADFFESYNEAQTEVERVKEQLALAAAQINYVTGTKNF
ncbi:TolC family protein [Flavobacterium sp. Sd200]|uniref:TolC family protein n=1 Tax=Flavobacterium sp. Sd200 TaxID=2692211 RepID=UPI001367DEAF|nr:TolC family protein [Flavobacterium sp. Sd200]MXN92884.1 TolC family protein [Flavobacterium sp. Sd200]